jgi:hypothetical protein
MHVATLARCESGNRWGSIELGTRPGISVIGYTDRGFP